MAHSETPANVGPTIQTAANSGHGLTMNIDASGPMHPAQVGAAVKPYVTGTSAPAMAGGGGVPT